MLIMGFRSLLLRILKICNIKNMYPLHDSCNDNKLYNRYLFNKILRKSIPNTLNTCIVLTFCANGTTVFPILFFNPLILSSTQLRLFYKISIQFFHTNIISPYHVNNNAEVLKVSLLHFPSTSVRFDNCKKT